MRRALLSLALFSAFPAHAQQSSPTLDEVLTRVRANVKAYVTTIPNFSCDESVDSQLVDGNKVKERMTIQSSFRMTRDAHDHQMHESRTKNLVDGKPSTGKPVTPPYTFTGGFANILQRLSDPCMDYRFPESGPLQNGKIVLVGTSKPASSTSIACNGQKTESTTFLDPTTLQVLRMESTTYDIHLKLGLMAHLFMTAPSDHNAMKTLVTYAPVALGDQTFWLPTIIENSITDSVKPVSLRYAASYSNYHRYAATVTILPSASTPPNQ